MKLYTIQMDFSTFLKGMKCGSCFRVDCNGICDARSQASVDEDEMMVPVLGLVKGPEGQCKLAPSWVSYCERSVWQKEQEEQMQGWQKEKDQRFQLGQLAQGWTTAVRVQRVCGQAEGFCGCLDCPECMLVQEALADLLSMQVTKEAALWARIQVMACKKIADLEEPVNEWIWDERELAALGIRI